jgi:hypothetical protein
MTSFIQEMQCKSCKEKQDKRIHALERALKMAGHNITCWACEHIGESGFCDTCNTAFSNWSFNQEVFGKEEQA